MKIFILFVFTYTLYYYTFLNHSNAGITREEILDTPFSGVGKPEALKHELLGYLSRQINREHRLIYKVVDQSVVIYSLRDHYK